MRTKLFAGGLLLAAPVWGCGDEGGDESEILDSSVETGDSGSGVDAAAPADAGGSPEAGRANDAGPALDATSGPVDAGVVDAASMDAGSSDAGASDAGIRDAQVSDGSASEAGSGDAGAVTFTRVYAILEAQCRSCHMGAQARGGLNMTNKSTAFMELTSPGDAEGTACMGNNRKRVVPLMPDMSLLYKKVAGTQDCGERMPAGRPALSAGEIADVRAWIQAGAMNN